eukprot:403330880
MSSVYSQKTSASVQSKNSMNSQVSNYMNKAKGGGYSKITQMKNEAQQREILDKLDNEKQRERRIIQEKKQREKEKERRLAEERLKKINEEQNYLKQKKDQQKEFYTRFLKQTNEQNLKKVEEKQSQNIHMLINQHDAQQQKVYSFQSAGSRRDIQGVINSNSNSQKVVEQLNMQNYQDQNQANSSKFQSKIPRPNFANNLPLPNKGFNQSNSLQDQEKEEKFISKMNGLDLELSQTKRLFNFQPNANNQSNKPETKSTFTKNPILSGNMSPDGNKKSKQTSSAQALNTQVQNYQQSNKQDTHKQSVFEDSLEIKPSKVPVINKIHTVQQQEEEVDLDRDSDGEDDDIFQDDKQLLNNDEMKLLGERIGFAGGRKQMSDFKQIDYFIDEKNSQQKEEQKCQNINKDISNKDWIESSIRQSVSQWKDMLKYGKENHDQNQNQQVIPQQKVTSWIDQQYEQDMKKQQQQNQESQIQHQILNQKPQIKAQQKSFDEENDEQTFGQNLQKLNEQNSQKEAKVKPPQSIISQNKPPAAPPKRGQSGVRRPSEIQDDNKSVISKASRASSKSKALSILQTGLSKEEELKQAKDKKAQLDAIKKQYSQVSKPSGSRRARSRSKGPSGKSESNTKCTREDDINVEQFMKEDLYSINKQEDKLQREILNLHMKNLHKHHQVVEKNQIDTKIKSTGELVRKIVNLPQNQSQNNQQISNKSVISQNQLMRPGVYEQEEDKIMESLDNLDLLLQNKNDPIKREEAIYKIGQKLNIDFNLNQDIQERKVNENKVSEGYGKAKQNAQVFEYQQPFAVVNSNQNQLQQIKVNNFIPQNQVKLPSPSNSQISQTASQQANPQPNIKQQQQQQPYLMQNQAQPVYQQKNQDGNVGFQFQPFNNASAISNIFSQQQKLQENLNYLTQMQQIQQQYQFNGNQQLYQPQPGNRMMQQDNNTNPNFGQQQQCGIYDQSKNNLQKMEKSTEQGIDTVKKHQQPLDLKGNEETVMFPTYQHNNLVRSNRDLIKMRQQAQRHDTQLTSNNNNDLGEDEESQQVNFGQYTNGNFYKQNPNNLENPNFKQQQVIEDSLNEQSFKQKLPQKQDKSHFLPSGDIVKVNPKFNMNLLFEDD